MRALGQRGPGIVPKRFKLLLRADREPYPMWPSFRTWVERASAGDIVAVYEVCRNPHVRGWMCYTVGIRGLHDALPMLVHALNDPDRSVRYEAADALGTLEDPRAGDDLFKRYAVEPDPGVRWMILIGMGWTRYAPALPMLIKALADESPGTGARAWTVYALANMGDRSALPALWQAYAEEPESRAKEHMGGAIEELDPTGSIPTPPLPPAPRAQGTRGRLRVDPAPSEAAWRAGDRVARRRSVDGGSVDKRTMTDLGFLRHRRKVR